MRISYKTVNTCLNEEVNEIYCKIDHKISSLSKKKLDSVRYSVKPSCTINYSVIKALSFYKKILSEKMENSSCLHSFKIEDIITKIKQILNTN